MASSESSAGGAADPAGPVILAYDGSELARLAIEDAARQVTRGRDALVVCVWQTDDVGFVPTVVQHFAAAEATEERNAADPPAAPGASLAAVGGVAEEHGANLIVRGSDRRSGIAGHLLGSVGSAVVAHSKSSVLITRTG